MHISQLLQRDGTCDLSNCAAAKCPGNCNIQTQDCTIVAPSCPSTCAQVRCEDKASNSNKGGTSPGALAGAVIGALLFLALVILGYLYYRRREAAKEAALRAQENIDVKPDIPARADAVLSRPDPHFAARASSTNSSNAEKRDIDTDVSEDGHVRIYSNQSDSTINLDPSQPLQSSGMSARSNPFTDKLSIQTASERSQSTNVIPIALVPPPQNVNAPPTRPPRPEGDDQLLDNELDVRLPYASSTRSGISGKSFMTTSSIATELDETPQIVTPTQGVVRQVLGVTPAQVVRVPSNGSGAKARNARGAALARQASKATTIGRSPLAQQSFTLADMNNEPSSPTSSRADPFTDAASPYNRESFADSARTTDTFGTPNYHSEGPFTPRPGATFNARPPSVASTADGFSIRADIGTASRVILGMQSAPATAVSPSFSQSGNLSPGFSQSRATSMQTNASVGRSIVGNEDDVESLRPYSIASHKTTSSRADSVLAAFPFVPPSPISALPPRSPSATSPGVSPASAGSTFARQQAALLTPLPNSPPVSPRSTTTTQGSLSPNTIIGRQSSTQGASSRITSTMSSASSGLETYPFQFGDEPSSASASVSRSRASLDTLKIAQDLAAFPLEHDKYPPANTRR